MSKEDVIISMLRILKGYHHCPFKVNEGKVFSVSKNRGECWNTFKVIDERSQLGHLQAKLVSSPWPLHANISA